MFKVVNCRQLGNVPGEGDTAQFIQIHFKVKVLKVKATGPFFLLPTYLFFGAAWPAWSVLQSNCVMAD